MMKAVKKLTFSILFFMLFGYANCFKEKLDLNGLPPATQQGKNKLGFLLNGEPWIPKGVRGRGNLSIHYDSRFNQGIFNIVAYDFSNPSSEQLIIGVRDSLNFINSPITLTLSKTSLYSISYNRPCDYFNQKADVTSSGILVITKLDRINRIIAGTFNALLIKNGCIKTEITEGRFDMKF